MLDGERLARHFIRKKSVGVEGFFERDGTLEVRHGGERNIRAVEKNFAGGGLQAGTFEHVGEPDAAPARISYCPVAPLQAGHRRLIEGAAITGALKNADELGGGQLFQVVQGERERRGDRAADIQAPFVDVHPRNVDMGADEKMFSRGEVVREAGKRHLEILGADGADQHVALGTIVGAKQGSRGEEEEVAARDAHPAIVNVLRGRRTYLRFE